MKSAFKARVAPPTNRGNVAGSIITTAPRPEPVAKLKRGGILIIPGLFTRPVAFVLSGEIAYAYFAIHFPRGFLPLRNGGELAVINCFILLLLALAGTGASSLDRIVRKRH